MAASNVQGTEPRIGELDPLGGHPAPEPGGDMGGAEEEEGGTMTLVEHLEELRRRLFYSAIAVALFSVLGFVFWNQILTFLTVPLPNVVDRIVPGGRASGTPKLIETHIGGPFLVSLKVAVATGIVIAMPVLLYQLWAFISPALTRREKKYALPFTLLGVVLFAVGLALGYVVLRYPVNWLVNFGSNQFILLPNADDYLTFVAYFLLIFGLVFELPLVITFLGMLGVVNSRVLRAKRVYILFGLWVAATFVTPGADPYSPIIVGLALTLLFELSIILLRILKK